MAKLSGAVHHVATVTDNRQQVISFLTEVLGFQNVNNYDVGGQAAADILSWPTASNQDVMLSMVGDTPHGLVEVIEIPNDLLSEVDPGIALMSVAVKDVEGVLDECRRRQYVCQGPRTVISATMHLTVGIVRVGGLVFELVRFEK